MSRNTLMTVLLIIVSLLLAVALFIAGAIWRGRTTARSTTTGAMRAPAYNSGFCCLQASKKTCACASLMHKAILRLLKPGCSAIPYLANVSEPVREN
jgi:hypothetical protein